MRRRVLAALLAAGAFGPLAAQEPARVRLALEEPPKVGRPAPEVRLPYATADGAGPADQPFDLAKELGRTVVLYLSPSAAAEGTLAEWGALGELLRDPIAAGVVAAVVTPDSLEVVVRQARDGAFPFKLLADPARNVARRFGVPGGRRMTPQALVIAPDGRVAWFDSAFRIQDPASAARLVAALRPAKEKS